MYNYNRTPGMRALDCLCKKTCCVFFLPFGLAIFGIFYLPTNMHTVPNVIQTTCIYVDPVVTNTTNCVEQTNVCLPYYTLYCTAKSTNNKYAEIILPNQELYQGTDTGALIEAQQTCIVSSTKTCYIAKNQLSFTHPDTHTVIDPGILGGMIVLIIIAGLSFVHVLVTCMSNSDSDDVCSYYCAPVFWIPYMFAWSYDKCNDCIQQRNTVNMIGQANQNYDDPPLPPPPPVQQQQQQQQQHVEPVNMKTLNNDHEIHQQNRDNLNDLYNYNNEINNIIPEPAPAVLEQTDNKINDNIKISKEIERLKLNDMKDIPQGTLCPITLQIMIDPVVCDDGNTYERAAIEKHLKTHKTSPLTNVRIKIISENRAIRYVIYEYLKNKGCNI